MSEGKKEEAKKDMFVTKDKKIAEDIRKGKSETEVSVPFSKFPFGKWVEWWSDCKINFGGCRWAKAYMDHQKAKENRLVDGLVARVDVLEDTLAKLLEQPEEEEVKTFGGG